MYCPQCGQQQINEDTRFCSRCGFLMSGVERLLSSGGAMPDYLVLNQKNQGISSRMRGVKKGALMFFSGMVIVPLLGILTAMMNGEGYVVGAAAIILFLGGILRMVYALIFETSNPAHSTLEDEIVTASKRILRKRNHEEALPPHQSIPISDYTPPQPASWRETDDLFSSNVTEETTNLRAKKQS